MDQNFDILRGEEKIGKAEVKREGLYYRFRCCCSLTGEVLYRLTATCSGRTENLGILIPVGDAFRLEKRLPASRFKAEAFVIRAVPANPDRGSQFIPVFPEEPFHYIARLNAARMERRDGQIGVIFEDQSASPLSSSNK